MRICTTPLVILSGTQCSEVSKSHKSKELANQCHKSESTNYNSIKVSDSLLICDSPKWILRFVLRTTLSMTSFICLDCHDLAKAESRNNEKCGDSHDSPTQSKSNLIFSKISIKCHDFLKNLGESYGYE